MGTVVLYLQYIARTAKSYAVVKSASGAIFTLHECALVPRCDNPTKSPAAKLVREAAKRTIGLKLLNQKEPLPVELLNDAILLYLEGPSEPPLWCLVICAMCKTMWMGFLRYSDASYVWVELMRFYPTHMEFLLTKRKNDVYREGDVVFILRDPDTRVCAVSLCERLIKAAKLKGTVCLFQGYDGYLSRWHPEQTALTGKAMAYQQLRSCVFKLVSKTTGLSVEEAQKLYGTQSLRSGGATIAAKKVSFATWKAHGAWKTDIIPLRYVGKTADERLQTTAGLVEYQVDSRKKSQK